MALAGQAGQGGLLRRAARRRGLPRGPGRRRTGRPAARPPAPRAGRCWHRPDPGEPGQQGGRPGRGGVRRRPSGPIRPGRECLVPQRPQVAVPPVQEQCRAVTEHGRGPLVVAPVLARRGHPPGPASWRRPRPGGSGTDREQLAGGSNGDVRRDTGAEQGGQHEQLVQRGRGVGQPDPPGGRRSRRTGPAGRPPPRPHVWLALSPATGRADRVEERDGQGPGLHREDLTHGQVGGAGPGRGEEQHGAPARRHRDRGQRAGGEQPRGEQQQDAGQDVGARDHRLAADRVEQPAEHQRADQVADGDDREVVARVGLDVEEDGEDLRVAERDRVVQEGLADEQREAQDGPARVAGHHGAGDGAEADRLALVDGDGLARLGQLLAGLLLDRVLDAGHQVFRFPAVAVDEQPARALRHVPPHQQDHQAEHDPEPEADPPADRHRQVVGRPARSAARRPRHRPSRCR